MLEMYYIRKNLRVCLSQVWSKIRRVVLDGMVGLLDLAGAVGIVGLVGLLGL